MKAIVCTRYGPPDVLQLQEVAKPIPRDNEVLIRIYATTVTAADCELRGLKFSLVLRLPIRRICVSRQTKTRIWDRSYPEKLKQSAKMYNVLSKETRLLDGAVYVWRLC